MAVSALLAFGAVTRHVAVATTGVACRASWLKLVRIVELDGRIDYVDKQFPQAVESPQDSHLNSLLQSWTLGINRPILTFCLQRGHLEAWNILPQSMVLVKEVVEASKWDDLE